MKHFLTIALVLLFFCQCNTGEKKENLVETPIYNEYVSQYTSGSVSRKTEIHVKFSHEIRQGCLDSIQAEKVMKITPKVEGVYTYADNRTLVFTPTKEMKRDTKYQVTVDVPRLFPDGQPFDFAFVTRPFAIGGTLKSFNITDDDQYELTYNLLTADSEDGGEVEKHIKLSMNGTTEWNHAADGLNHLLKVCVKPTSDDTMILSAIEDKTLGAEEKEISTIELPSTEKFTIVGQRSKPGETKCIEITFNKNLDEKQDIRGLVYIEGKTTQPVVEGNKVFLYGSLRDNETVKVNISSKLRSRSGKTIETSNVLTINISSEKPAVEFVGDGTIIPLSDKILIPFRAIQMKGVRVMVFKMFSNTMGSVLQRNDIDDIGNFVYAARPIAATTFYMDDKGTDYNEWHTYAIDLSDQVKLEPGAMYRVELSLDARLSTWPCDTLPKATREEMAEEDARLMQKISSQFDESNYYYYTGRAYSSDYWWDDDYYKLRNDPGSRHYYRNKAIGKNVLATNIGLTALHGSSNTMNVTAINLPDAQPLGDVSIEAYSQQQQLTGRTKTNAEGIANLEYDTRIGRPAYLVARKGDDVSYLKVDDELSLSTSTFDVSGSVVEKGLKGYIYGERGVWRPGDTLHIGFMLNDKARTLPQNHPVTLKLSNPLGQVTNRISKTNGIMGIYAFNIPTPQDAPTGIWNAEISVGGVTFNKSLRIESIKPNRLKIGLDFAQKVLSNGSNNATLNVEWLNGNKANNLKYEIDATIVESTTSWKNYKGFVFDDLTKSFETSEVNLTKGQTSESGSASCLFNINIGKSAPGMLRANLVTHVYEPSGEFSVDVAQAQIAPYSRFVGIKAPQQEEHQHLDTDTNHSYQVVSLDKEGKPIAEVQLHIKVYKVQWYWWWRSYRNNLAGYTSSKYNQTIQAFDILTDKQGIGSFVLNFSEGNWGTYLITAEDKDSGHTSAVLSYFDWPWMDSRRSSEGGDNATVLSITTDKTEYAPGDKMHINIPSEEGSRAIVSINNGSKTLLFNTYPCQKDRTEIVIEATEDMTPNVYIGVSLVQPYQQTVNDMPIRMYGITPVTITSNKSKLNPEITCANEFEPESKAQVTVSEKNGREMGYTLAIVDEGLLDLTHFKTPNAWGQFNAREALGVRFWDIYKHVNGAYGGRIEQLFSIGGDDALNNSPKAIVNRFTPMVHFVGPFSLKKGEKRNHQIPVPNYNGRVRVMVVAGDGTAYGNADKSVLVRRPLMLLGTMPRQIGRDDEMTVSATVFATEALGEVKVTLSTSDNLNVIGDKSRTINFDAAGDKTVQFRIKTGKQGGTGIVSLKATSGSNKADYTSPIAIRTVSQPISKTISTRIEKGSTFDQTLDIPGYDNNKLLLDVSATKPLNLISRLGYLIAYPHGCVEQITSKAFPQLYLNEFSYMHPEQQAQVEENIKECINRLRSYQTIDGGMSYWPSSAISHPWGSAYVLYFLYEASAHGYYIPEDMMQRLKNYVVKSANNWKSDTKDSNIAFQLYVLAHMQSAEIGVMNRMREHANELPESSINLLSAAYALAGHKDIAKELYDKGGKSTYYSWFSKKLTRLTAEMLLDSKNAMELAEEVRQQLMSDTWLSTSECSFSLTTLSQFYKKNGTATSLKFNVSVDGKNIANINSSDKFSWNIEQPVSTKQSHIKIQNNSDAGIYITATATGLAVQEKIASCSNGLTLSLQYSNNNGEKLDPTSLPQSKTFKATLTIRNSSNKDLEHIAVTHILPAGWEILSTLPASAVSYQDVRDDRLLSYIDRLNRGQVVEISFCISATYAGKYYLPSVRAEAMYDNTLNGCTESGECEVK